MDLPQPHSLDVAAIEALCRSASGGDVEALEQLLWHHNARLLGFVRRKIGVDWQGKIDAEDVLQEAFVKIFAAAKDFTYAGEDSFYRWASRIVDHTFIDQVRHQRRQKRDATREVALRSSSRHGMLLDHVLRDSVTPSRIMRREDAVAAMLACMARLPDDYRQVIQRMYLDEEPLKEIAANMGRTEDALRRLAGRAVEQLGRCMGRASKYLSLGG